MSRGLTVEGASDDMCAGRRRLLRRVLRQALGEPVYLKLYKERRFVAGEFHVNIFVVHFRQFGHDLIALVGFGDVDGRQRGKSYLRMPERLDERAAERQAPRAE